MRFRIDAIYRHETEMGPLSDGGAITHETVLQLHAPEMPRGQKLNVDHEWGKRLQVGDFLVLDKENVFKSPVSDEPGTRGETVSVGVGCHKFNIPEAVIIKLLEARGYRVS